MDSAIEAFTIGKDRELDLLLAPHDILGSMAHVLMLESIGLMDKEELPPVYTALQELYARSLEPDFVIEEGIEDIHSQVELMLTSKLGDLGKKIHSGRSRNDQVLLDLKLFSRARLEELVVKADQLADTLLGKANSIKRS